MIPNFAPSTATFQFVAAVPARPIIPLPDTPIEYPPAEEPEEEPAGTPAQPAETPAEPVTVPAPAEPVPALSGV